MRVWKWPLELVEEQSLIMPKSAEVVAVQMQGSTPCIWALCDEKAKVEQRTFAMYGTGYEMPDNPGTYIGTFQVPGLRYVFHLFAKKA